jgi:hypothetical protein
MALMEATQLQEVGGGIAGGDGAFGGMTDSWRIVIQEGESAFPGVKGLSEDVLVRQHASELEVAHGQVTRGVLVGDEAVLDVRRKGSAPQKGRGIVDKPYTPHAQFGSVGSTNTVRVIRAKLSETGWMGMEVNSKGLKVVKLCSDVAINTDAVTVRVANTRLQSTEQAVATGDGEDHAAEFAEDLLPSPEGDMLGTPECIKDGAEAFVAVRR